MGVSYVDLRGMRKILLSLLVTLSLAVVPAVGQAAAKSSQRAAEEQQVMTLLNQVRAQHGLAPFAASAALHNAARFHSSDMLQRGYFDHNSPNQAWDARISRYLKAPLIGEDIAWGQGSYGTPEGLQFGFPVRSDGSTWQVVEGLEHDDFAAGRIATTTQELLDERDEVKALGLLP